MSVVELPAGIEDLPDEELFRLLAEIEGTPKIEPFVLSDLKIISKSEGKGGGKLVSLAPNESQEMYLDDISDYCPSFDWRRNIFDITGLRLDVLKYRQWGCSTITIGLYLLDTLNHAHVQSRIIAHNPTTTADLLQIARIMYDNLDPSRRPHLVYDNRGELGFSNGSSIRVMLVGSKGAGRGGTVKNFLLSERAFWPSNGNEIEYGLLQSVPSGGNVVRETTANGLDDFYQQYKEDEAGNRDYKPLFYGWAPHKDYSRKLPQNFKVDKKEEELQRLYGLSDGQLCFRREKTKEALSLGKKFEQEYPLNCLTGESRVSTEKGILSIRSIERLDARHAQNGQIDRYFVNPTGPVFILTTCYGRILRGTANHPVLTSEGFVLLGDLKPGQSLALEQPEFARFYYTHTWSAHPWQRNEVRILPDTARLLGYFMGDGSWFTNDLSIACDAKDQDVVQDVKSLVEGLLGVPAHVRNISRVKGRKGADEIRASVTKLRETFLELGLIYQRVGRAYSRNICVPECIWRSPKHIVREFLRGLFEADGSAATVGTVNFASSKLDFIRDVQLLLMGFGINARLVHAIKIAGSGHKYSNWRLNLNAIGSRRFFDEIGFVSERKNSLRKTASHVGRPPKDSMYDEVLSVEPDGEEETYDLTVSDSHIFAANGILTHNSTEAFIGSGSNYYNNDYLLTLAQAMRSKEGIEIHKPAISIAIGENGFHCAFKVFKEPEPGKLYVGGADPAGGISKDGKQNHASFHLFDLESWEEVLHYHGDPDPWDFGIDISAIASWYNEAQVAVLRMNHGHETLRAMRECSCTGIVCDEDTQYGIIENSRTKVEMDDKLGTIINDMARGEPGLALHSVESIEELITYSHLPGGKAGASGTAFDDRQSSLKAAVWQLIRDDRRYKLPQKAPPEPELIYGTRRR